MKYCITDHRRALPLEVLQEADEILIPFFLNEKLSILVEYFKRLKPKESQKVIVEIFESENYAANLDAVIDLASLGEFYNFSVSGGYHTILHYMSVFKEHKIPFFFRERIDSWDKLVGAVEAGAAEVYICNELAFDLERDKKYCLMYNNVQVRVWPNIYQTSWYDSLIMKDLTGFFMRPEDQYIYERYVDTLEIFGDNEAKQKVLLKIYKNKKWLGDLKTLIIGLPVEVDNKGFLPYFAATRAKCKKRCHQSECDICKRCLSLSNTMAENNKEFEVKKE